MPSIIQMTIHTRAYTQNKHVLPYDELNSCLHTIPASLLSHALLQILPQMFPKQTSTTPSISELPLTSLSSPTVHESVSSAGGFTVNQKKYIAILIPLQRNKNCIHEQYTSFHRCLQHILIFQLFQIRTTFTQNVLNVLQK